MKDSFNNSLRFTDKILIIATFNENKFIEIANALHSWKIPIGSLRNLSGIPEAPETGTTFEENAKQKAAFYTEHAKGHPVLAEDSGLVIPSMDGFPGIYSARIGKDDRSRIDTVLKRLREQENSGKSSSRFAYYVCSMCLMTQTGSWIVEGRCEGSIMQEPLGNFGFGYDPIFRPDGSEKTFGQMTLAEKSRFSHRAKAAEKILPYLIKEFS